MNEPYFLNVFVSRLTYQSGKVAGLGKVRGGQIAQMRQAARHSHALIEIRCAGVLISG